MFFEQVKSLVSLETKSTAPEKEDITAWETKNDVQAKNAIFIYHLLL